MNRDYFQGKSELCTHILNGNYKTKYDSVGFYGHNGKVVDDINQIPSPFFRSEPGTDFYIMGIDYDEILNENRVDDMIKSVLSNFWFAIQRGKLEVSIVMYDKTEYIVDKESLPDLMDKYYPIEEADSRSYNPNIFYQSVANLGDNNRKYYLFQENLLHIGEVSLYVNLVNGHRDYVIGMRKPLMRVHDIKMNSKNGICGVFVCENDTGNSILRDLENTTHNEWSDKHIKSKLQPKVGRKVLKEIRAFIDRVKEQLFRVNESNTQDIKDLEKFLYIPTDVEDDLDNLTDMPDLDDQKEEDVPIKLISNKDIQRKEFDDKNSQNISQAVIDGPKTRGQKDDTGDILGGKKGSLPKKKKGPNLGRHGNLERYKETFDLNGTEGFYGRAIQVDYRTYAKENEMGRMIHFITVRSPLDAGKARIDVHCALEGNEEEKIQIVSSSLGQVEGCSIEDLQLSRTNPLRLEIEFADNMKHAIKLETYV